LDGHISRAARWKSLGRMSFPDVVDGSAAPLRLATV
jgi:hypothetical protein